jgi:uncharacterized membrane protein YtjA (UPF0391 family)
MIELVVTFLILAIVAGLLGFTGVEIISIEIAQTLFYIFLILFIISLLFRLLSGRQP